MSLLLIDQFSQFATVATAALVNAAIPSIVVVALAFAAMRLQAWNAATRYCACWLLLGFVVLLPFGLAVSKSPGKLEIAPARALEHHLVVNDSPRYATSENAAPQSSKLFVPSGSRPSWQLPGLAAIAPIFFLFWCAATLVHFSRIALGLFANARLKRSAFEPADPALVALFSRLVANAKVDRPVRLGVAEGIAAPLAIGYRTPYILLPAHLIQELDLAEKEQVLSHELAHIARYDDWAIAIERAIGGLFSLHPLVFFVSRRLDLDREISCDDKVIHFCQPCAYANCLTKIAELSHTEPSAALAMPLLSRKSHLVTRVETMLDRSRAHLPSLSLRHLLPFGAVGCVALLLSLRAPALLAAPAFEGVPAAPEMQAPVIAALPPAPVQPTQTASAPQEPPAVVGDHRTAALSAKSGHHSTGSIIVTGADGSSSTFEENGKGWHDHSALPRNTIVFERDGRSYIIRDSATMAAARALFARSEELSRQQEALGAQQEKLGEEQAKLGQQQQALAERHLDPATFKNLEKQIHELETRLRSMDLEKSLGRVNEAQDRVAELQSLLGNMQSSLGEEQGKSGEAQGKLGEEQGKLGEQQGRLGEQQGKLGEQQGIEAKRIEKELRKLIQQSESRGLAQPLQ